MKQHSSRFLTLVDNAKKKIKEINAKTLHEKLNQKQPLHVIDVREESEWGAGHIPTAIHMSKGVIERDIEKKIPDVDAEIVVYCSGGFRCALVAEALQMMGYHQVSSLDKGLQGWVDAGYEMQK